MFHERLKAMRAQCGKTQKDLADYLNISPQSVSKWEKGESLPSIEYLPKMAMFLHCDINTFFKEQKAYSNGSLKEKLDELEEELEDLMEAESDEDIYEEWKDDVDDLREQIQEVKEKLRVKHSKEGDVGISKKARPKVCEQVEYEEFFTLTKAVLLGQKHESELVEYLKQNPQMKASITYIFDIMISRRQVSISSIQRCMRMGYNMAGTIIDGLENIGVITPFNGCTPREIIYKQVRKLKPFLI